jgi:hypothetical protein
VVIGIVEFYAKITPVHKGIYKHCSTVWKSENGIDSVWKTKKFIRIFPAYRWALKNIIKNVSTQSESLFIKEQDTIRRKWNE